MKSKKSKQVNLKTLNLEKLKVTSLKEVKGGNDAPYSYEMECNSAEWC